MGITNQGTQTIFYDYKLPTTGAQFIKSFRDIVKPGIYSGGALYKINDTTIGINPICLVLHSGDDSIVKINTSEIISKTVSDSASIVYAKYSYVATEENYAEFLTRADGSPITNEIILGKINFLSGAVNSFDYADKTYGFFDEDFNIYVDEIFESLTGGGVGIEDTTVKDNSINDVDLLSGSGSGVDLEGLVFENDKIEDVNFKDIIQTKIKKFTVESGKSVSAGDVVEFINDSIRTGIGEEVLEFGSSVVLEEVSSSYLTATVVSENKVLIAYKGTSGYGTAIVCDISGTTPTFGNLVVFESVIVNYLSVVTISENKVLISYQDAGNSDYGTSIVGTISGTVPTFGSSEVFENAGTSLISSTTISEDKVLIVYNDNGNSNHGTAIVGTISGTTPTFGSAVDFESGGTVYIASTLISENKVLVAYKDQGNTDKGTAIICTISGTVPTFGSAVVFADALTSFISATLIAEDKVFIAYQDTASGTDGTAIVGTVSGTTPTFGTEVVFETVPISYTSVTAIEENKVLIAYRNSNNDDGTIIVGTITGTVPKFDESSIVFTGNVGELTSILVIDNKFLITYRDVGNSNYGTAVVCEASNILGIAQESGTSGESVYVTLNNSVSYVHTGLAPSIEYYSSGGSDLTAFNNDLFRIHDRKYIGKALSSSELLISFI